MLFLYIPSLFISVIYQWVWHQKIQTFEEVLGEVDFIHSQESIKGLQFKVRKKKDFFIEDKPFGDALSKIFKNRFTL